MIKKLQFLVVLLVGASGVGSAGELVLRRARRTAVREKLNGCPRVSGLLWATGGERFRWLQSPGGNGKLAPSSPDLNWLVVLTGLGKKSRCSFGSRLPSLNATGESMAGIPPVASFMARGQIEGGLWPKSQDIGARRRDAGAVIV